MGKGSRCAESQAYDQGPIVAPYDYEYEYVDLGHVPIAHARADVVEIWPAPKWLVRAKGGTCGYRPGTFVPQRISHWIASDSPLFG